MDDISMNTALESALQLVKIRASKKARNKEFFVYLENNLTFIPDEDCINFLFTLYTCFNLGVSSQSLRKAVDFKNNTFSYQKACNNLLYILEKPKRDLINLKAEMVKNGDSINKDGNVSEFIEENENKIRELNERFDEIDNTSKKFMALVKVTHDKINANKRDDNLREISRLKQDLVGLKGELEKYQQEQTETTTNPKADFPNEEFEKVLLSIESEIKTLATSNSEVIRELTRLRDFIEAKEEKQDSQTQSLSVQQDDVPEENEQPVKGFKKDILSRLLGDKSNAKKKESKTKEQIPEVSGVTPKEQEVRKVREALERLKTENKLDENQFHVLIVLLKEGATIEELESIAGQGLPPDIMRKLYDFYYRKDKKEKIGQETNAEMNSYSSYTKTDDKSNEVEEENPESQNKDDETEEVDSSDEGFYEDEC